MTDPRQSNNRFTSVSVLDSLMEVMPDLHPQMYFKSSLTALSHAIEDLVLAGGGDPVVIANFQRERFYRQEAQRYRRISQLSSQVYVLAAPETDFRNESGLYEKVAFQPGDALSNEWHLVVIGTKYSACLICREHWRNDDSGSSEERLAMDQTRRFEGIWTFDRQVSCEAANLLLARIERYRPELLEKVSQARSQLTLERSTGHQEIDPDPFAQRLITYLQAGQYKLQKAYRSIAAQERRERLINLVTAAIRRSLNPTEIFTVAVQELGQAMDVCRCIIYPCKAADDHAVIEHEFLSGGSLKSLVNYPWPLQENPLFQAIAHGKEAVAIDDTQASEEINTDELKQLVRQWNIRSWLIVPILYQGQVTGMIELHECSDRLHRWSADDLSMVEAIAAQLGIALIQAESYDNLGKLNQQLEALEVTRSNLIAITGHELRTPLSTIQVCLESLASEPDMSLELRQVMLSTALDDAERLRKLVQDFLTLSQLESGRVEWHLEALSLEECISLALSSIRTRQHNEQLPEITTHVPEELPLVRADGEWLVEVLSKLLDNACKFTKPEGEVTIEVQRNSNGMLEVTIKDTGRGIEPNRLEAVFERFYQEEGALRRTAGGTGLGLAICRQVIVNLGGRIWAESAGRDQGSQFHFTIPVSKGETDSVTVPSKMQASTSKHTKKAKKRSTAKRG
ncbi:MAG: DICT sensory domain-containing protein [Leptolyngbyaceae bacterium]|nr:DICT sensory domain-containing protein [Leptolyngbyaceae bacterium]